MATAAKMRKSPTVLVVEDEPLICDMVANGLTDDGFDVRTAANAAEALVRIAGESAIDVLFTDINLPGGVDGSQLAWLARAMRPDLTVVYASGRVDSLPPGRRVDGSIFVPKPYTPDQISDLLRNLPLPFSS